MENNMTKAKAKPYLAVGTKVFVKNFDSHDWTPRRFKKWSVCGKMVCYIGSLTSFKNAGGEKWNLWRVVDGKFAGETNFNKENNNV